MSSLLTDESSTARRRLVARIALISATAAILFPSRANATEDWSYGVGVFVGYTFGPRQGVEWGLEGFATHLSVKDECSKQPRAGIGPLAQFAIIGLRDPRFTLAAQGGSELAVDGPSLTGELGLTYRLGMDPGPGIHLGISPGAPFVAGYARAELLLDDYSLGGGLRFLPTYGLSATCVIGRPLRTNEGRAVIDDRAARPSKVPSKCVAPADARAKLAGRAWERDAQYECASVPAFLELAEALLACGAPLHLVERALNAACDEIAHARLCAGLASRYLAEQVVPNLPDWRPRVPLGGRSGLIRLAVESWVDGCLGEGAAARQAERAAELAVEVNARAAQLRIAGDESRHAELGWQILAWAMRQGGPEVREAVRALRTVDPRPTSVDEAPESAPNLGRLAAIEINTLVERNAIESRRRLDLLLGSC